MKKYLAGLFIMGFGTCCFAYDKYGTWTKVDQIYIPANGGNLFVYFQGADSLPGCYGGRGAYLPSANVEGANRIYSALLAARAADRTVQVFYNYTSTDEETWGRCTLEAIYFK